MLTDYVNKYINDRNNFSFVEKKEKPAEYQPQTQEYTFGLGGSAPTSADAMSGVPSTRQSRYVQSRQSREVGGIMSPYLSAKYNQTSKDDETLSQEAFRHSKGSVPLDFAGRTTQQGRGRDGLIAGQLEPGSQGVEFYKLPTAQPMSRRQKAQRERLSKRFGQIGHRNSDKGLQQEGFETEQPAGNNRFFNMSKHQATLSGEYAFDINDRRQKSFDATGGFKFRHSRQTSILVGDQMQRAGLKTGGYKASGADAEDNQSVKLEEAAYKTAGGFNRKARPFKSMKPLKPGANEEEVIPMFGTQPPLDSPYKTAQAFRKPPRIKGFMHAKAAQMASTLNQSRQGTTSSRSRRQRISLPADARPAMEEDEVQHDGDPSIENPVFSISKLRLPYHMLGGKSKEQLKVCQGQYSRVNNTFLDKHIEPRVVIFVEDGTNLKYVDPPRNKQGRLLYGTKVGPNNVAIDVNRYIAKYDFDIALKLQPEEEKVSGPYKPSTVDLFNKNAVMEILQICSHELATDERCYNSLWTLHGQQITDLNDLPADTKVCLASYLPMDDTKPLEKAGTSPSSQPDGGLAGLQGNDFAVNNWKDYYQLSMQKTEAGVEATKEKWFEGAHQRWMQANEKVLERAHLDTEFKCQQVDPKALAVYAKRGQPDAGKRSDGPSASLTRRMKFKDFKPLASQSVQQHRGGHGERLSMDGMITAHLFKQKTKMNFETFFAYKEPNKHLPQELKQINEVKQYMVLHGMDEADASQYLAQASGAPKEKEPSLLISKAKSSESQDQLGKRTLQDFKPRARSRVMPRAARRISREIERQNARGHGAVSKEQHVSKKQKSTKSTGKQEIMDYDKVQEWGRKYSLPGGVVYQLDAEFTSLVKIQVQELQKEIAKIQKTLFTTSEKEAEAAKVQMYALQEVLKEVQAGPAISLACLLEFSDCTQDKFREIMERIIGAFDAGVVGPGARIGFELYVEIKCFLQQQTLGRNQKVDLWMKILNPATSSTLPKRELRELFEKFARGKLQEEPTLVSDVFADRMILLFEKEGLEDPSQPDNISMKQIEAKLSDGTFDIELFHQMILPESHYEVKSKNHAFD